MIDQLLSSSYSPNSIPFRFERYEEDKAVLVFESPEEENRWQILWPIKKIPEEIKPGQKVWLQISNQPTRDREKQEILNNLLEEIIA